MSLAKLVKPRGTKVLGIDASTNSFAFCLMNGKEAIKWGEITFEGSNIYERILDAKRKIKSFKNQLDTDFVAIEAAISVKSIHTGIKMAYVFGAIMGELLTDNVEVVEIHPITWQSYLGNKNFTKNEKQAVKNEFPGKSENWYKGKIRELRKARTIEFVRRMGINTENDNVADAAGIAWYAINEIVSK
jgi:Holliday junction resolvasome RuvABC endonuclease subunit